MLPRFEGFNHMSSCGTELKRSAPRLMLLASLSGLKPRKRSPIFALKAGKLSAGRALMMG